jgi:hypothetical protein
MSGQSKQEAQPKARATYALRRLVLHDSEGSFTEAVMDGECVDITYILRALPVGRDEEGQQEYSDAMHRVRLSAAEMDRLARAWLRYRTSADGTSAGEQGTPPQA